MTKEIYLSNGYYSTVDDCDFEMLKSARWHVVSKRNGSKYAASSNSELMHRVILGLKPGDNIQVDHIDHNGLNNTRANLRRASNSQNNCNKGKYISNKVGFKGVTIRKGYSRYRAQITVNGNQIYLGYFNTAEEAARMYDDAARKYHGEFANLNFKGV